MEKNAKKYDVVIVGGGVTGTALLYVLAKYTDVKNIALVEKYEKLALMNSNRDMNSQTLHFGDIETNYAPEKAKKVKEASELLAGYLEKYAKNVFRKTHKMVLAVGEEEVKKLEERYEIFREIFPKLEKLDREDISKKEPKVIEGRSGKEKVLALSSEDGYAVDYGKLSESFVSEAKKTDKNIDIFLGERMLKLEKAGSGWRVVTDTHILEAEAVEVAAGPHSLVLAKEVGYGRHLGILPVAGSFYHGKGMLNGKVYTMQIEKLPFAAIHGDPNVNDPGETRFGPTAKVLPVLERHNYATTLDFLRSSAFNLDGILSLLKIISDRTLFLYMLKNLLYDIPFLGKRIFLEDVRKIIPLAKYADISYGRGLGGIRPQVVNVKEKRLDMGESKILGENIIFNITPSPGASVCLKTAEGDAETIIGFLGKEHVFDRELFKKDLRRD